MLLAILGRIEMALGRANQAVVSTESGSTGIDSTRRGQGNVSRTNRKLGTAVKLTGNTQTAECQAGKPVAVAMPTSRSRSDLGTSHHKRLHSQVDGRLPGLIVVCFGGFWVLVSRSQMRGTWGTHCSGRTHFHGT